MTKRLMVTEEELYPIYMEIDSHPHHDIIVPDDFYEKYTKAMKDFRDVQRQLSKMIKEAEKGDVQSRMY